MHKLTGLYLVAVTATSETDSDSDDDVLDLEDADDTPVHSGDAFAAAGIQEGNVSKAQIKSRSEKRARKLMSKLGLKQVPDVTRVAIRKSKNTYFIIDKPDVFKHPAGETYIVFGEAKVRTYFNKWLTCLSYRKH